MFISFEGIDGSGKSTQVKMLTGRLEDAGFSVKVFREPGGTLLSERIRALLLDSKLSMHPFAEMLLFSAARSQLVSEEIKPGLEAGDIVICDRFFDSTIAYQGAGRELGDAAWLMDFQHRVTDGLIPDRTYLLRVPAETGLSRITVRANGRHDRIEKGGAAFFQRVLDAYDELAGNEPERFVVLDGSLPVVELHERIWADFWDAWKTVSGTRV